MKNALAKTQNHAILCDMGLEHPVKAGAVTVKAATSSNNIAQMPCILAALRERSCEIMTDTTCDVVLTPYQSRFFCTDLELREKRIELNHKEICEVRKVTPQQKKSAKKAGLSLDFSGKCGILYTIGCGSLMSKAEVVSVNGGNLLKKSNADSLYFFEPAGSAVRRIVTFDTTSTPAGSFFVPDVEVWGKSRKDLIERRLEKCKTILQTLNRTLFSPIFTATTPPGVCPIFPQFRSTTPEPNL